MGETLTLVDQNGFGVGNPDLLCLRVVRSLSLVLEKNQEDEERLRASSSSLIETKLG